LLAPSAKISRIAMAFSRRKKGQAFFISFQLFASLSCELVCAKEEFHSGGRGALCHLKMLSEGSIWCPFLRHDVLMLHDNKCNLKLN
jgi:hypothetical protein